MSSPVPHSALLAGLAGLVVVVAGCGGDDDIDAEETLPAMITDSSTTAAPTSTTTSAPAPTVTEASADRFSSSVHEVTADELGLSWREGCPVGPDELRRLELAHWNDDGVASTGALVVHADHVDDIVSVFARLFDAAFPVHSMQMIAAFEADDDRSMAANNTSGFNCREVAGSAGTWSEHAFGTAVDINPLVNPWVRGERVDPPQGEAFVDRTLEVSGMIVDGDIVTQAFAEIGWTWGGDWSWAKDWQHFSANGR